MIDLNDILRQNEDASMKEAARSIYILFQSLCEAGFTEDQAMQVVTATIGNIRNGGAEMSDDLKPVRCGCGGPTKIDYIYIETYNHEHDCPVDEPVYRVFCEQCGISTPFAYPNEAEAVTAWNRAMAGAKDINVPNKGFWKPVYESEATGFDPSLAGCDPVFNHVCSVCGQETWTNDMGKEYLSDFCPNCGADMR